jgi:hypothetical protein
MRNGRSRFKFDVSRFASREAQIGPTFFLRFEPIFERETKIVFVFHLFVNFLINNAK